MEHTISFSTTHYSGYEEDVLRLRNRNRSYTKTREYMDWRYLGRNTCRPSVVFWVHAGDGTRIGMAALFFHRYRVNNHIDEFAVLGDISLDSDFRGKGIAKQLFEFINSYIEEESISCTFVMPNDAARKSLGSAGWETKEILIRHTFFLNPTEKINEFVKNRYVSLLIGKLIQGYYNLKLGFIDHKDLKLITVDNVDDSFDSFWESLPKQGLILRDRNSAELNWRYKDHPHEQFEIAKLRLGDEFIGFIIYTNLREKRTCSRKRESSS